YILGLLPRGTHHWDKLIRPDELEALLERNGLQVIDERGVTLDILAGDLRLSHDLDINYMVVAERPAQAAFRLGRIRKRSRSSYSVAFSCGKPASTFPENAFKGSARDGFGLALGGLHLDRRGGADGAQCHAARAHRAPRHGRRDACALPVRLSVRAPVDS